VRATRAVVKRASAPSANPGVVARRREPQPSQNRGQLHRGARALDRGQQLRLGLRGREPLAVERQVARPKHDEQQAHYGEQKADAVFEANDLGLKLGHISVKDIHRDDVGHPSAKPAIDGGLGDAEVTGDARVAGLRGKFADAVIVCAPARGHGHRVRIAGALGRFKAGRLLPSHPEEHRDFAMVANAYRGLPDVLIRSWAAPLRST